MVSDPPPAVATDARVDSPVSDPGEPPAKVRIRFRKGGDLRFLSHHDLMRTFERMLRRAEIPFRNTQGFHPKPRLVFALSLPLGVVGLEEVVELELSRPLSGEVIMSALAGQAPAGLDILSIRSVEFRACAQVCRLCYRVPLPADALDPVRQRVADLLASPEHWIERTRPPVRRIDLRPSIRDLRVTAGVEGTALEMDLSPTPAGTARPDEILRLLGLESLIDSGAVLERSRLELGDESPSPPAPPDVIATGSGGHSAGTTPVVEGIA
jgi:radical SAM-linked protein